MIEISRINEEIDLACDDPLWIVDEEDGRHFTREPFGSVGDGWATVYGIELLWSNRMAAAIFRVLGMPDRNSTRSPSGNFLELRVCSPSFAEHDRRFISPHGQPRALVQEEFAPQVVEEFCRDRVRRAARRWNCFEALERDFYVLDPDED